MVNAIGKVLGFKAKCAMLIVMQTVFACAKRNFVSGIKLHTRLVGNNRHNDSAVFRQNNGGNRIILNKVCVVASIGYNGCIVA